MNIGEPRRVIEIVPVELPVPSELPIEEPSAPEPSAPATPVEPEPAGIPADGR
ncbi:MAG TPA: hypothetical protein VF044_10700 [Actinomycetota bacterium]